MPHCGGQNVSPRRSDSADSTCRATSRRLGERSPGYEILALHTTVGERRGLSIMDHKYLDLTARKERPNVCGRARTMGWDTRVMADPTGFDWTTRKNGEVVITHHGRHAATLRGYKADRFLRDLEQRDPQQLMARVTGNYKHGNERR